MNIISRILQSSIGKKYIMAATGCLLFGFVIIHLLGNLQIFLGPDMLNAYAKLLQSNKLVLWGFRAGMFALILTHVTTAVMLTLENRAARPIGYIHSSAPYASFASKTMFFGGAALFAFIIYHLLHFTLGVAQPSIMHFEDAQGRHDVYKMAVLGFSNPAVSLTYIVAMFFLYLHLSHGVSSFFQSLGLKHKQFALLITLFSQGAALVIFLGNCAIPIAILLNIVHLR